MRATAQLKEAQSYFKQQLEALKNFRYTNEKGGNNV